LKHSVTLQSQLEHELNESRRANQECVVPTKREPNVAHEEGCRVLSARIGGTARPPHSAFHSTRQQSCVYSHQPTQPRLLKARTKRHTAAPYTPVTWSTIGTHQPTCRTAAEQTA